MAGSVPGVRLVRCPKCRIVLPEVAEVPVYKCGGCDTILRAKNRGAEVGGATSSGSLQNNSQNLSDNGSKDRIADTVKGSEIKEKIIEAEKGQKDSTNEQTEATVDARSKLDHTFESIRPSRAESSHSYEGSSRSSSSGNAENRLPDKYLHLSKRTFRKNKFSDSVDGNSVSAVRGSLASNGDELPYRPRILTVGRDDTFGSEDFHSVRNWMGSETDEGAPKSQSSEPDHVRILRKVDELRDELSGFLIRTAEGKRASKFNRRERFPRPRNMHCQADKAQTPANEGDNLPRGEKKLAVKSHCRPVSGGAPFVVCYKCWKLLQLPADFLVTQKRLHKLRCGACSKILVFSFRPRERGVPMTPVEARHPPSEADNNNDRVGWDPISYSDDYGVSFVQSYSSEGEPGLHVSRDSAYSVERDDEVKGSQLHRLMGYPSASELLFRPRAVDEGYQSTEPDTPHFYRPSKEMRHGLNGSEAVNPASAEIEEEDEPQERLRNRRKRLALRGLLKKGVRELSHGLENVKLKIHSNG